jgi:uncharacterized protein
MVKKLSFKIHKSYRWVVAICDEDLVGKIFIDGDRQLDLSGNFFKGDLMDENEVSSEILRCAREDATFNVIGEDAVRIAVSTGIARREDVFEIDGIPFILVLL